MTALVGAIIGALLASGLLLVASSFRGVGGKRARSAEVTARLRARASLVAFALAVGWLLTGLPALGIVLAMVAAVGPDIVATRRARLAASERTAALASWAEMLRDSIASHAGLHQAIAVTAELAPEPVRGPVETLVRRAEQETLSVALGRFGQEVADPIGDLIVAALRVAADGQANDLPALLGEIASTARADAQMALRVEAGRARTYSSSQALVVITLGLSGGLALFAPTFMAPYGSSTGQLVLIVIGALFAAALLALARLGGPEIMPRVLSAAGESPGFE